MSSLLTKKQDKKMAQNNDNEQDAKKRLPDKFGVCEVVRTLKNI